MSKIYYYQNNPCTIVRDINEDFAEIQIAHCFQQDMETHGHCMGCNVGDSDNKLSCTCDDYAWIIEEFQNEENKILAMVEKRLLLEKPVEHRDIVRLKKCIEKNKADLEKVKSLHQEWHDSLKSKKAEVEALEKKKDALESQIQCLNVDYGKMKGKIGDLKQKLDETLVELTNYYSQPKQIKRSEYENLLSRDKKLSKLEAGGVDNWEWYDESINTPD